jgi:hypothetical protein
VRERVFPLTNAPWTDKKNCFLAETIIAVIVMETHFLDLSCNNFYDTVLDSFLETKVQEWIVTKFGWGGGVTYTNAKKKVLECHSGMHPEKELLVRHKKISLVLGNPKFIKEITSSTKHKTSENESLLGYSTMLSHWS